jgi:hypothetical protein
VPILRQFPSKYDQHRGLHSYSYSETNMTTYRPTNEQCLMRRVTSPNFCPPCIEGLWRSLLRRVSLIDGMSSGSHGPDAHSDQNHTYIELHLLPLAQFRETNIFSEPLKESFSITYSRLGNGNVIHKFQNSTNFFINDDEVRIWFHVEIEFHTDEVRSDPDGLLRTSLFFVVLGNFEDQTELKLVVTSDPPRAST